MALIISFFSFLALLGIYEWLVRSSEDIAGGLLIGRRRRRKRLVVSGGGIVLLGALFWGGYGWGAETTVISFMVILGFIDDWRDVAISIRLLFYLAAVVLILYGQGWMQLGGWLAFFVFLLYLGFVNAVNFMDGVNGLVVLQSLVILCGMLWSGVWADVGEFIWILLGFTLAFSVFNVRKSARMYLGDAGSVGLGFVLMGLVLWKIYGGLSWGYLMYFVVMALDAGLVLCWRILRRENVLKKHHQHLYQRLVRGLGWHEVLVSGGYAFVQLLVIVIWERGLRTSESGLLGLLILVLVLAVLYVVFYWWVLRREAELAKE